MWKALLIGALSISAAIQAEVQQVTLTWTAALCQGSCVQGLERQFRKINGVDDVAINQAAGQANLKWKPGIAFTSTSVYNAMAMIGLYIKTVRVRVVGEVSNSGQTFYLVSSGDGTPFMLLGSIQPSQTQYVQKQNMQTRLLDPATQQQLMQYAQAHQQIVIEGPLFEAYRSPPQPLMLIAERIQVNQGQPQQ